VAARVFLHIGAPKTGTTYLQAVLAKNRQALAERGVLYPTLKASAHHRAVWDLRGIPEQRQGAQGVKGTWNALADEVNAWSSDAVVSSEHFVFATAPQIDRALTSFAGEVHVMYTARDLVRQVPAVWQERIKNQKTMTYRSFVESVMQADTRLGRTFWTAQDAAAVLRRWSVGLSPERMHVVTAPPPGQPHRVLWDRFARVLGLDGTLFGVEVDGSANSSLTMVQTELVRRYNERHATDVDWSTYRLVMFRQLDVLTAISDGRKVGMTAAEYAFFQTKAAEISAELEHAGYDLVGDLADLVPASPPAADAGKGPTELTDAELLDAALDVIHRLLPARVGRRASGGTSLRTTDAVVGPPVPLAREFASKDLGVGREGCAGR
jgi:hypothetical protein